MSLETIPFSASSLVRSISREGGQVSPGLTVLECAWEGSGGLDWPCGHLILSPSAVFQNNRATETTPVLRVLNGLYSRNLNVQSTALPPPRTCFLAQEPTECSRSYSQLFNDKPNAFVLERRLGFLSFQHRHCSLG